MVVVVVVIVVLPVSAKGGVVTLENAHRCSVQSASSLPRNPFSSFKSVLLRCQVPNTGRELRAGLAKHHFQIRSTVTSGYESCIREAGGRDDNRE